MAEKAIMKDSVFYGIEEKEKPGCFGKHKDFKECRSCLFAQLCKAAKPKRGRKPASEKVEEA